MPFDRTTGKPLQNFEGEDYSVLTGELLLNKMKKDKSVVFVTAAVPSNVGFPKENREKAGKPIFGTNATFIQRTYDQFSQDVCINQSPVTTILNYRLYLG